MPRTPRNTLSPELIVRTALELMEANGADAFSLRGVAAELGVGPMALYTYFRNKDDLYDAVRDHLMGLLPAVPADVSWPDQVRAVCRSLRLLMLQHPCLAQLLASRPLSGHETARVAEGLLGVLRGAEAEGGFEHVGPDRLRAGLRQKSGGHCQRDRRDLETRGG